MKFNKKLQKNSKMQSDFSQSIGIEKINENEIPESWKLVKFQEIIELKHGHQFRNYDFVEKGIPVIKIGQCKDDGTLELSNCDFIDNDRLAEFSEFTINKGDLLMALTGGTIGKVTLVDKDYGILVQNYRVGKFVPNEDYCIKEFATLILKSSYFQNLINNNVNQSAQPNIGKEQINQFLLPLPSIAEQQRIVARVETLLTHVNAACYRLNRVPLIMKQFRQGVLSAACSGRLTEGWREVHEGDIDNNKIIVNNQNIDTDLNVNFELPDSWIWTNLESVCEIKSGYAFSSKDFRDNGVTAIKISNIGYSEFLWKNQEFLPEDFVKKYSDFLVLPNDLLIALTRPITNDTVKICIYPKDAPIGLLNQRVAMIKPSNNYEKNLLLYYLQSNVFKEQISFGIAETLQPNLSPLKLGKFFIPLPPLAEQHEIVFRVNALFERTDAIERDVVVATKRTEALTQAVLAKAFRGELVPAGMAEGQA